MRKEVRKGIRRTSGGRGKGGRRGRESGNMVARDTSSGRRVDRDEDIWLRTVVLEELDAGLDFGRRKGCSKKKGNATTLYCVYSVIHCEPPHLSRQYSNSWWRNRSRYYCEQYEAISNPMEQLELQLFVHIELKVKENGYPPHHDLLISTVFA